MLNISRTEIIQYYRESYLEVGIMRFSYAGPGSGPGSEDTAIDLVRGQ